MYTAAQGVSWSRGKMVSDIPISNQDSAVWKVMYTTELWLLKTKKAERNDLISLSLWKNGCGHLFWNHISLKNTLKTKQNWQCWIYCPLLFCLGRLLFVPLPWKLWAYLSLRPFYNNVPFLSKQQRKYQVKPLPLSNDQLNSAPGLQTVHTHQHTHTHVSPHAVTLLMKNIRVVNQISVSACIWFFLDLSSWEWRKREAAVSLFPVRMLEISKTLDGDRKKWPRPSHTGSLQGLVRVRRNSEYCCLHLETQHTFV